MSNKRISFEAMDRFTTHNGLTVYTPELNPQLPIFCLTGSTKASKPIFTFIRSLIQILMERRESAVPAKLSGLKHSLLTAFTIKSVWLFGR